MLRTVPTFRYPLGLQGAEETLHRRVVPALPVETHALLKLMRCQLVSEFMAGLLASLVRVEQYTFRPTLSSTAMRKDRLSVLRQRRTKKTNPLHGEQINPGQPKNTAIVCLAGCR